MTSLTLLIPTRNRPFFLSKTLRYYANMGCKHVIMIGDASSPSEYGQNQSVVQEFSGILHVIHHRHNPETNPTGGANPVASTVKLLEEVDTPYAVWSGDDDFLVPAHLQKCVDFLESHNDHSLACGKAAWVFVDILPDQRLEISQIWAGTDRLIQSEVPSRRLVEYAYPSVAINTFSVQRTQNMLYNWERAFQILGPGKHYDHLHEIAVNVMSLIQGKQVALPGLYHVMLRHNQKVAPAKGWDLFQRLLEWDWPNQVKNVLDWLATGLADHEGIEHEKASRIVEAAFLYCILPLLTRQRGYRLAEMGLLPQEEFHNKPLKHYLAKIPGARKIWRLLNGQYTFSLSDWRNNGRYEISLNAFLDHRSVYHDDFMAIYNCLTTAEGSPCGSALPSAH